MNVVWKTSLMVPSVSSCNRDFKIRIVYLADFYIKYIKKKISKEFSKYFKDF